MSIDSNVKVLFINNHELFEDNCNYYKYTIDTTIIWKINNRYIFNDLISSEIVNFMCTTTLDYEKYLLKSIKYKYDIILKKLLKHKYFKVLNENTFENIKDYAIQSNNLGIIELFYEYIPNLKEIIKKRKSEKNFKLLKYCRFSKKIIDYLYNIKDIVNNYEKFENYTKISLFDPDYLEKINNFTKQNANENDFKKIRSNYNQRNIKLKNIIIEMFKNDEYFPLLKKEYTFVKQEKIIFSYMNDTE